MHLTPTRRHAGCLVATLPASAAPAVWGRCAGTFRRKSAPVLMPDKQTLKENIRSAFDHAKYPGDWCLRGSNEGDEPYRVERDFKGKTDWKVLDPGFIDQAPDGLASALSFFSDEAFHFFLPAYMISDIDDRLDRSDPVFHLTHGLDDDSRNKLINPRRYGERTWFHQTSCKFAMFTKKEAAAIVAYLRFKAESDSFDRDLIEQSLRNYWIQQMGETGVAPNDNPATRLGNSGVTEAAIGG